MGEWLRTLQHKPKFWLVLLILYLFVIAMNWTENAGDSRWLRWLNDTPQGQMQPAAAPAPTELPPAAATVNPEQPSSEPVQSTSDLAQIDAPPQIVSRELITTTHAVPVADWQAGAARFVALAADGSIVAFTARPQAITSTGTTTESLATYDLLYLYVPGDNAQTDDDLIQITRGLDGAPPNGWIGAPSLSADGSTVAFYAWASNLVAGDTNAVQDAFVYSRRSGQITRISMGYQGRQANGRSGDADGARPPALSADGRYVAYHAVASNLVTDDTNGVSDLFLFDRSLGLTMLLSTGVEGEAANGPSQHPHLSPDGRYVVFSSQASNLDQEQPRQTPFDVAQIYWHDRTTGSTRLLSRGVDGRPGNGTSQDAKVSADGRYVVFSSTADNLVPGDTNQVEDIFLFDLESARLQRVSVADVGAQANRAAWWPTMTADGRYIAYVSTATNLVSGDGNQVADLFLHDLWTRHTSRVSVSVTAPWTGREADGPVESQAQLTDDGQRIVFVADASLAPEASSGVPNLFQHVRRPPPTFAISGQILDRTQQPVEGVTVVAGLQRTTTDAEGRYTLDHLIGGTYTLAAAKPGYSFSPSRRTLSLLNDMDAQDFIATAGASEAFLDLPFAYDGADMTLLRSLRDTDEGGLVDAWFDHDAPTYAKNDRIVLWDGQPRSEGGYNLRLGCFERRCYDGHDGIDFPYRDPDPTTPAYEPVLIRPAAPGRVIAVVEGCGIGQRLCNGGYGNEVILDHFNGYFTRYSHLANLRVGIDDGLVNDETTLGDMGATGNSYGIHLHFAVHQDDGNTRWDGEKIDLPVDPFGWASEQPDPWATTDDGAVSQWLWRRSPTAEVILLGGEDAVLRDGTGSIVVELPAAAFSGQVRVELGPSTITQPPPQRVAGEAASMRQIGRGFRLHLLDWKRPRSTCSAPDRASPGPTRCAHGQLSRCCHTPCRGRADVALSLG